MTPAGYEGDAAAASKQLFWSAAAYEQALTSQPQLWSVADTVSPQHDLTFLLC